MSQTNNSQYNDMTAEEFFALNQNSEPTLFASIEEAEAFIASETPDVVPIQKFIEADLEDLEELLEPIYPRQTTIEGPRILTRDFDIYVTQYDKDNFIIKSCITDKPVLNRRYNKITGYVEKIDPTLEEEDRRLVIIAADPTAILEEDYIKDLIQLQKEFLENS